MSDWAGILRGVVKLPTRIGPISRRCARSFPENSLGRTAALLSLVFLVLGFAGAVDLAFKHLFGSTIQPVWLYYLLLFGLPILVVIVQLIVEWRADFNRRRAQTLSIRGDQVPTGYFV